MNKRSRLLVAIVVGVCFVVGLSSWSVCQAAPKKITLKAISAWATNDSSVKEDFLGFVESANKAVQKKYPGELEIKHIGGPEAVPVRDQAEALRIGTVDVYFGTPAYYVGIAPEANISKMTQLTPMEERAVGAHDVFDEIHRKKLNAVYLGRPGNQLPFQMWGNKEVKAPADLKGHRIRVSPMYIDFVKALGAIPIETKPGDIYQALERGVVDGYCWPYTKIRDHGFHEVTKYVIGPAFYNVCHPVLVNLDSWNKMPKHLQDLLVEVMKEEERIVTARDLAKIEKEKEMLKKVGLKFIQFSPEDTKKYLDLAGSSGWEGLIARSPDYGPKLRKMLTK